MIALILRLLLFITPLVCLYFWLRWRRAKLQEGADLKKEMKLIRFTLVSLMIAIVSLAFALRLMDDDHGRPDQEYTPPHLKDGEVVPGKFNDKNPPESEEKQSSTSKDEETEGTP